MTMSEWSESSARLKRSAKECHDYLTMPSVARTEQSGEVGDREMTLSEEQA